MPNTRANPDPPLVFDPLETVYHFSGRSLFLIGCCAFFPDPFHRGFLRFVYQIEQQKWFLMKRTRGREGSLEEHFFSFFSLDVQIPFAFPFSFHFLFLFSFPPFTPFSIGRLDKVRFNELK